MSSRFESSCQRGSSLVYALLILFAMTALGVAGLSSARFGLTLSNNYRTGIQAVQAAESGIVHAAKVVDNALPARMDTDVYNVWGALFGSSAVQMPGYSNISYTVTATSPDPNRGTTQRNLMITSVGQAPGESQRTQIAHLQMLGPFSCGAIDMPNTDLNAPTFRGNHFAVDGNDYNMDGSTPSPVRPPTLGISTRNQTDANTVIGAVSNGQTNNITGINIGPNLPSVGSCSGPSVNRVNNTIVPAILAQPHTSNPNLNGHDTFGTNAAPQITYFSGNVTINGTCDGYGILVVDGNLTVTGDMTFTGLIIVRGTTQFQFTGVEGNATILGAIWTTDLNLDVQGSASVSYSSPALSFANAIPGTQPNLLPEHVAIVGWSSS